MKVVKEYKRSVKIECNSCRRNFVSVKGSPCHVAGLCSNCNKDNTPELVPAWRK